MNKKIIIQFFRYLWIAIGVIIIFFVLSQAFYTKRSLEYNLNFSESNTQNIRGWYPEIRISDVSITSVNNTFDIIAEPLYMKVYTPINFERLTIQGGILPHQEEDIRLGLKQTDGSWDFKKIEVIDFYFSTSFDMANAQIKNNQLEIILSIPNMTSPARVSLVDNWQVILSR